VSPSWLRNRFVPGALRSRLGDIRTAARRRRSNPRVEQLEDRRLLTINIITQFDAMNFAQNGAGTPPDTHIAVGDKYVIEGVNTSIAAYDKQGNNVLTQTFGDFFSPIGTSNASFLSDPYILWDDFVNRFYVMILDVNLSSNYSDVLLAVSNDNNPTDGFSAMDRIHVGNGDFFDYEKAGFNKEALVITANDFTATDTPLEVFAIDKSTILQGATSTFKIYLSQRDSSNFRAMWPAQMHGAPAGSPMYFTEENGYQNGLAMKVVTMTNILSNSPAFTDTPIPVNPYFPTPSPVDPGGPISGAIDAGSHAADWRNDMLVMTNDVGGAASNGAVEKTRFYEFSTSGTPSLVQQGEIDQGTNDSTYEGSIAIAPDGSLGMSFIQSSDSQFMSMYVTGQSAADPLGTMQTPIEVRPGEADEFGGRVGDYAASCVDPTDGSFWVANEFATADDLWGTHIVHMQVGKPNIVTGHIFEDVNNDKTDDPGDPGLAGITVYADLSGSGTFVPGDPTAVTDANGDYAIRGLPNATFKVSTSLSVGQFQTTPSPSITVSGGITASAPDIGVFRDATISGNVYNDLTGTGTFNAADPALAGFKVLLIDAGTGKILHSQLSDANGNYKFPNVAPGTYQVREFAKAGFVQTSQNPPNLVLGQRSNQQITPAVDPGLAFGNFKASSISGQVFQDVDGSGVLKGGDPALAGWQVQLIDPSSGKVLSTSNSDSGGNYSFTNLGPGTFRLREVVQTGYVQTTALPPDQTSLSGANVKGVNFGDFQLNSVSGQVFNDLSASGSFQTGDPGLAGWTVNLTNVGTKASISTTTDQNGNFSFSGITAGTYSIQEALPTGWQQTTPAPANFTAVSGGGDSGISFGNFQQITVSGTVFQDLNGNGIEDGSDAGISSIQVQLVNAANSNVIAAINPDSNGNFVFSGLTPGKYLVQEVLPSGWLQTTQNPSAIVPVSGQNVTGLTFGNFQTISISGQVFQDNNASGVETGNDPGLQGWSVQLLDATNGNVLNTATTDSAGNYTFANLGPGTYQVLDVAQAGFLQTTANPANVTASSGTNITGLTFGEFHSGSISGQVFQDTNGNGTLDGTETGLTGITVQFLTSSGTVLNSATTDANGNFVFNGALFGNYSINAVIPTGWTSTTPSSVNITVSGSGQGVTGISIGLLQYGSISGQVFQDNNGNAKLDGNETGLSGITVQLVNATSKAVITTQATDKSGNYTFSNLKPGSYVVTEALPAGWMQTTASLSSIAIVSGTNATAPGIGIFKFGSISGQVFNDLQDSGTLSAGDTGVAGAQVQLVNSSGKLIATTTTNASGDYTFSGLTADTYRIALVQPANVTITTPAPAAITISSNFNISGISFGEFQRGQVTGRVVNDPYGDGVDSPSLAGLPGYTINLFQVGAKSNTFIASTVTGANGSFTFTGLGAGGYIVQEVKQSERIATFPHGLLNYSFTIASASNVQTADFGNIGSPNRSFVFQAYHDLLHRAPDHPGMDAWSALLDSGAPRSAVVQGIQGSVEYLYQEINSLYQNLLHRPVDAFGLSNAISLLTNTQYVPGTGDLLLQLEVDILSSPEYYFNRGGGTNAGFLSAVYGDVLGRGIDSTGASVFGAQLASGVSPAVVAKEILFSTESEARIVNLDYLTLLHRNADPTGMNAFLGVLQQGGTNDQIIAALVSSSEYFQRL
jgi:protocatechuate 3,4-dioxygenase beta subunit